MEFRSLMEQVIPLVKGARFNRIMASTNPGEVMKPLISIASTGELSRFTLALKSALSETDNVRALIFDEIDIGVGGRKRRILGKKLWNPRTAAITVNLHHSISLKLLGLRLTPISEFTEKSRGPHFNHAANRSTVNHELRRLTRCFPARNTRLRIEKRKKRLKKPSTWKNPQGKMEPKLSIYSASNLSRVIVNSTPAVEPSVFCYNIVTEGYVKTISE